MSWDVNTKLLEIVYFLLSFPASFKYILLLFQTIYLIAVIKLETIRFHLKLLF